MKEQPPISVLLAAGIAIALGGALFAESVVEYGGIGFSFSAVFAVSLGFGLLKGFEIARAWLMVLSGIAGLAGCLTFVVGPLMLMVSAPDGPDSFAEILSYLPLLVLGVGAFLGSRHLATRSWCKEEDSLNSRTALKFAGVYLLLGAAVGVPKSVSDKQEATVYPVFCTVKFQTGFKDEPGEYVTYHGTESSEGTKQPKILVSFKQDNELRPSWTLEGVAYQPFQVGFSIPGFKKYDYTISNGSPREVTLTLVPEKQPVRAEKGK
ncbi:MAG: hypothetical protein ACO1QS_05930 [Verrucomicrobiota bacterium]